MQIEGMLSEEGNAKANQQAQFPSLGAADRAGSSGALQVFFVHNSLFRLFCLLHHLQLCEALIQDLN